MDLGQLRDQALKHILKGQNLEAIDVYKRLLKIDRTQISYCAKIAELYVKSGDTAQAVRWYEVAAKKYAEHGSLPKAAAIAKTVAALDPSRQELGDLLAKLYAKRDAADQPLELSESVPEAEPLALDVVDEELIEEGLVVLEDLEEEVIEGLIEGPSLDALASKLPKIPIFSELPPEEFGKLLDLMELKAFAAGEVVLEEGDEGDAFYIITAGTASVRKVNAAGATVELAILKEGTFFGEFAYLSGTRRTASVIANEELEVLEIVRANLDSMIAEFPRVKQVLEKFFRDRSLQTLLTISPLFAALSKTERDAVAAGFEYAEVKSGAAVIEEKQIGKGLFLLAFGAVTVDMKTDWGGEEHLADLKAGDFFGEMALLYQQPTTASVTAVSKSAVFFLSRGKFLALVERFPHFHEILTGVAEERRQANQALEDNLAKIGEEGLL